MLVGRQSLPALAWQDRTFTLLVAGWGAVVVGQGAFEWRALAPITRAPPQGLQLAAAASAVIPNFRRINLSRLMAGGGVENDN